MSPVERGAPVTVSLVRTGAYRDSVALLALARELRASAGVVEAAALIGTDANKDDRGAPVGIDIRKAVETGIAPLINTGMAGKVPGTGQIGAGVVRAPLACFEGALDAFGARAGAT